MINEVFVGNDGKVRQALVKYKNYKVGERDHEYTGCEELAVSRSVHHVQNFSNPVVVSKVVEPSSLKQPPHSCPY